MQELLDAGVPQTRILYLNFEDERLLPLTVDNLRSIPDAYLLYQTPIHTRSEKARVVNPRKLYVVDSGLAAKSSLYGRQDYGALLENTVFMHLRRQKHQIAYLVNSDGTEVDFITTSREGARRLLQVSWTVADADTWEREQRALTRAMTELGVGQATVVTAVDPAREVSTGSGTIHIVPAWRWLLSLCNVE